MEPEPETEYCLDFYSRIATALVDQLALERFHWVGTSMGGAIGMVCAAGPLRGRIERLVLNDIGPKTGRRRHRTHPQLRRQPGGVRHRG